MSSIFAVAQDNEVEVKELSKKDSTVSLEVTAQASLVDKCFQNALVQVQARAQVQGFRAGKAPMAIVKKNFSGHIQERALDLVIRNASGKALEKSKLNAVMMPSITKADFTSLKENAPFTFEMAVDVAPEFTPKGYTGIEVKKKADTITEEDVKKHLDEILDHNSSLESDAPGATIGDDSFAVVKYSGSKDGVADKKYSSDGELVDMSAPQTIAGLADAIKGAKKGDTKEFEAKLDDGAIKFTVQIEDIKKKIKPELNDEFVKNMGFDSVEKLKETVKTSMEKEAKLNSERDFTAQIEDALVKENTFALPSSLVEYHTQLAVDNFINRMFGGKKADFTEENKKAFAQRMRPNVEKDLKIGYIVHAIAEKENLNATDADWQVELDKALAENPKDQDKVKTFFNERKGDILASLNEKKVFDFLKAKANIK
ncbi:MAG: trigger factor [Elusimicrobiota bacterium]|jgi:trigger factor|nr:trigger factor [Elusimicrobiota bacterium]